MKLMCGKDCRRTQDVPPTLDGLKQAVWDLFGERNVHLMTSDTQTPLSTEAQYQSVLSYHQSVPPGILKIQILPIPARLPVPAPIPNPSKIDMSDLTLFPQCSMCLQKMTGEESVYQFTCKHVYCPSCIQNQRISLGKPACKIDGCQVLAGEQNRLKEQIVDLRGKVERKGVEGLQNEVEALYDDINAALVPCFALIEGNCPDVRRCRYDHSSYARITAKGLKSAQSSTAVIQATKSLPSLIPQPVPIEEEKRIETNSLPKIESPPVQNPTVFDQMELAQSRIEPIVRDPIKSMVPLTGQSRQYDVKACADLIRTSIRSSFIALESARKSQLSQFHVKCSICGKSPILGCVFQCSSCDVFLCPKCELGSDHPHALFKVKRSEQIKEKVQKPEVQIERKAGYETEEEMLKKLSDMGFRNKDAAHLALLRSNFNVDNAVEFLLFPH